MGNISQTIKYFDSPKLIIVDRDPRDIYATMVNEKRLLGADIGDSNILEKYLTWHKATRVRANIDIENYNLNKNILNINFEDFFIDYDKTLFRIKEFLDIDFYHSKKGSRFSPRQIEGHVGIWKNLKDQKAISRIGEELNIASNYE